MRNFRARHDRLGAPEPFRSGSLASGPGGLLLVGLAGFPRRSGGRLPVVAAPIGVVARRRPRTRSRIHAQTVGQFPRQLVLPPSPSLQFLARHRGEVGSLPGRVESARHANRRIPFAPPRKPKIAPNTEPVSTSRDPRKWGDVNGYVDGIYLGCVSGVHKVKIRVGTYVYLSYFQKEHDGLIERLHCSITAKLLHKTTSVPTLIE